MSSVDDRGTRDPLEGALLEGKYRVQHRIGGGGMGTIYLATDIGIDRQVAIKVLNDVQTNEATAVQRFQREATSMKSLNHPNIVRLYAVGWHDGRSFLVLEYVEGKTLAQLLKERGSLSLSECFDVWQQIIAGVMHAHEKGVLHRDLKPNNILLTTTGDSERTVVKVADFGLARLVDDPSQKLTRTGSFVGTAPYMSPEQLSGGTMTHAGDQYSIGCLMYECLFGRPPYTGDSFFAVAFAHSRAELQIPECTAGDIALPGSMEQCLRTVLAKTPDGRFGSLAQLSEALKRIENNPNERLPTRQRGRTSSRGKNNRIPNLAIVAVLVLLGVIAVACFGIDRDNARRQFSAQLAFAREAARDGNFVMSEDRIQQAYAIATANNIQKLEAANSLEDISRTAFHHWDTMSPEQRQPLGRIIVKTVILLNEAGEDAAAVKLACESFYYFLGRNNHLGSVINSDTPMVEEVLDHAVKPGYSERLKPQNLMTQFRSCFGVLSAGYLKAAQSTAISPDQKRQYLLAAERVLLKELRLQTEGYVVTPLEHQILSYHMLIDAQKQLGKSDEARKSSDELERLEASLQKR